MGYRGFRDHAGTEWRVWEVRPRAAQVADALDGEDRRSPDPILLYKGRERRSPRPTPDPPRVFTPGLENGWLTFESATEKRRLAPIPPSWEAMDDDGLEALLTTARPVSKMGSGA
jgi:hypothetical protein